jgi:4-hydroxyphenylpyruvate dioxygenase-like putative hemolysin
LHVKQYRKDGVRHVALQEQNIVAGIDVKEAASLAVLRA